MSSSIAVAALSPLLPHITPPHHFHNALLWSSDQSIRSGVVCGGSGGRMLLWEDSLAVISLSPHAHTTAPAPTSTQHSRRRIILSSQHLRSSRNFIDVSPIHRKATNIRCGCRHINMEDFRKRYRQHDILISKHLIPSHHIHGKVFPATPTPPINVKLDNHTLKGCIYSEYSKRVSL